MSYGDIATPRIYCDWMNWLLLKGRMALTDITITGGTPAMVAGSNLYDMFGLKPSNLQSITANGIATQIVLKINTNMATASSQETSFVAILGHNLKTADAKFKLQTDNDTNFDSAQTPTMVEVVNCNVGGGYSVPLNNGWSLFTYTQATDNQYIRLLIESVADNYDTNIQISSIMVGKHVDMPHRPDGNFSRGSDISNNVQETQGGARYSTLDFSSGPNWYLSPYQIGTGTTPSLIRRSGRLSFNLNFSFVPSSSMLPNDYTGTDWATDDTIMNVLEYTNGSHFPCLIQWDNTSANKPMSDFLFCRLYPGEAVQTSPSTWSIPIQVEEEF